MSDVQRVEQFPWQPQSTVRGNLAIGNLHSNLLEGLKNERGVHAETALAVFGAVAGAAAQHAAWAEIRGGKRAKTEMITAQSRSGEIFYMGDLLNSYLLPQRGYKRLTLWPLLAGAAVECGVLPADMPAVEPMFAAVAKSLGTAEFGFPHVPTDHRPSMGARDAVKMIWPHAVRVLRLEPPDVIRENEPPLTEQHWAAIAAVVAQGLLRKVKDVLDPKIALVITMETAIAASKLQLPRETG